MSSPVICFGQQPCGIFPNRFVFSKIKTARRLQSEIGGKIVFFLHDSDHDHRETCSKLINKHSGKQERINFTVQNKTQKLYSPLYCKTIAEGWKEKTQRCLPNLVAPELVDIFSEVESENVTDFCLKMYQGMGLIDGIDVIRSSDAKLRQDAIDIEDYFVDVPYEGETVRARAKDGGYYLYKGGSNYFEIPVDKIEKSQINPTRDSRLLWMQSIVHCTHYVTGAGEIQYLNTDEAPEIEFVKRDDIDRSGDAYTDIAHEW